MLSLWIYYFERFYLLMDSILIPVWERAYNSLQISSNIPTKRIHSLLKIEFDGKCHRSTSKHLSHFIVNFKYYKITNYLFK